MSHAHQHTATDPTVEASPSPTSHRVLVNEEEQYCLWPAYKATPAGWSMIFEGSREACLAEVERLWTDLRPKSVRG